MKHLSFFTNSTRDFDGGRTGVDTMVTTRSLFRKTLLFLAFILLPMTGWAKDATAALDAVKASGTGSYYELDLVPAIKDTAYVGYNSTGSGSGSTITTSHWKLSSSRTINFKVKNCSKIEIYAEFLKDKTTSVKYKIGSGTATEFMTNGTSKKCVRTASFNTGTNGEVVVTISTDQDLLLGTAKFYPIALTKHSVTYSAGDGSGTVPTHADVAEQDTFHVASAAGLTAPAGQEFKCWNDGTNDVAAGATYTMGTNAVTLTAQWQNITQKFAVTFAANGGTGEMTALQKAAGAEVTLPACTFTAPAGKAFDKWTVEGVSGVTELADGGSFTMPANAVNLTATYKKVPVVIYDFNNSIGSQSVKAGGATITGTTEMSFSGGSDQITITPKTKSKIEDGATINVSGTSNSDSKYFGVKVYKADGTTLLANVVAPALVKKGTVTNAQVVLSLDDDLDDIVIARYESTTTKVKSFTITNPAAKDTDSIAIELSDLKVAGTSVSDEDLATLKSQKTLTLIGSFVSAPEITFVEKTTIFFTDETQKVKYNNIVKQAESVSEGFYTVTATINNVTYTVKAPAVQSVKAAFYDGAKKLGVLDVQYNTAPVAAQYAAFQVKPLSTFDKWYSDAEFQTAADMSAAITDSTTYFGKWTTAYAQSIDMEQFVIENTKKGDYATFIANKNWQLSNAKELDSLNSAKTANNYPYLGLKFNSASGEVLGNITAGKLVTIKTGNMPSDNAARIVYANAKDTTYLKKNTDAIPTISYMYSDAAEVLKFQTLTGSTTMLKAILVTDPYVVTFTNGGTINPMTFTGTPLTLPNATGEGEFQGWFDAETGGTKVGMNGDSYTPTASIELFAQFSALSTNNEIVSFTFADSTVIATEGKRDYTINLPYKGIVPDTLTYIVAEEHATSGQVTKNGNVLSFTVTAQNGAPANYIVTFEVAPKDPLCIIKATHKGATTADVTGLIGGTVDKNTQSGGKLGSDGHYFGIKLAEGTFLAGDKLTIYASSTSTKVQIFSDKGTTMLNEGVFGEGGIYTFTLTAATEWIYLYRTSTAGSAMNPTVGYMQVDRPMNPVLTKATICDKVATIDESAKTVTVEVPFSTDITAVTPAFEYVSNDNSKVVITPAGAQDFSAAKTYRFTDKDGDYTEYEVSLTKAAASSDATLKSLSVTGYTLDPAFAAETLEYTIERAYKDKDAELPAISYEVNYAAATAVKTTEGKVVTITVTAEDGTTQKAYTITFTNKAASTDATLKSLMYGDKAITLVADQYTYNVNLPYGTTDVPALTAVKNDELASDPVINDATAFVDFKATSTATVTAESGDEQVYTVNFTVAEFPSVAIFDGSTMTAMATSPDASGLSWTVVGTTMSPADKSATYQDVSYTKSLQLGNTSTTKHFTITVPENKMAKIHLLIMTNSSTSTRSAWITTTADKGNKEDAIMSVSSSSYTDLGDGTTDWLEDNTTYYLHTDNSVNFFVISVELKPIDPKCEVPAITAQPQSNTQFGAGDMTTSVTASVTDGGTLSYQWYNASDDSEVAGATAATLTTTTEGSYYVIITNTLADHRDNFVKSETAQLGYRKLDDATLSALGYGETAITLVDAQYTYEVELAKGTTEVPALTATTSSPYATKVITDATAFVDYKATSTVVVTAEDGTTQLTYTVNFTVRHDVELQDVTGNMTWDFTNSGAVDAQVNGQDGTYLVLANCDGVKSSFNGQYMSANFNKITTGNLQGKGIKIHTTTPGLITIEFSNTGKKDNNRVLYINGVATTAKSKNTTHVTYSQMMPAGDILLQGFEETATWNLLNFYKITFTQATRLDRSDLTAGKVTGVCLENNVTHFLGAKFYYLSHKATDESYIELASVDTLKEGYPYIMIAEGKDVYYMPGTVTATAAQNYNGLYGTFVDQPLGDGYCIFLNNKYYRTHDGNNNGCYAHRAYLKLDEVSTTAQPAPGEEQVNPVARRIRLGSAEAQTATGFDMIGETELGEPRKFIINDQVVIIRGGQMYNAQGALLK